MEMPCFAFSSEIPSTIYGRRVMSLFCLHLLKNCPVKEQERKALLLDVVCEINRKQLSPVFTQFSVDCQAKGQSP